MREHAREVRNEMEKTIKCVVWDLDETIWSGTLLEGDDVVLREGIGSVIKKLDERGILQSLASKNDFDVAWPQIRRFGLDEYFLYPQVHWRSKAVSITEIAGSLNIWKDTVAFVDDQPFEREEVRFHHPEVLCIDAADALKIPGMPRMQPRFVTKDSRIRRKMYLDEIRRREVEETFEGPQDASLETLEMKMSIGPALAGDLRRAEELTVRTNQLNTTGVTYSYEELDRFRRSSDYMLLITGLEDRFGSYGKIGLALIETRGETWIIRLLLMSCRVMARGVGAVFINQIRLMAREAGVSLRAEFKVTERNRLMYMTYKFSRFREVENREGRVLMECDLAEIPPHPSYVQVVSTCGEG